MNRNTQDFIDAEYRVKISHFSRQGFDIKGVVHVGANDGYEVQWYQKLGIENIICFEPLPLAIEKFKKHYPEVPCYPFALSDKDTTATFYQYGDDGMGSSLQKVKPDHSEVRRTWSEDYLNPVSKQEVEVRRFDSFVEELSSYRAADYDCLVVDVQGHELKVLKGFGKYLTDFKYLNIECSKVPMYKGESTADEVIEYLASQGLIQDSPIEDHDDIFFVRKDIKSESDLVYRGLA